MGKSFFDKVKISTQFINLNGGKLEPFPLKFEIKQVYCVTIITLTSAIGKKRCKRYND